MTNPKFTPAPWHVENRDKPYVMKKNGIALTQILECSVISREQADANAHLIATAPEMYAALESACTVMSVGYVCTKMCQGCPLGKALRKARGESEVDE